MTTVFNAQNTEWKTGNYSLFLGQRPALFDTINMRQPAIQNLALRQVSQRWVFDEFNHEQSRLDLISCPRSVYEVMLMNIAYQWEADSMASRAIAPLFAPFVTDSQLWEALLENTNMEVTHAKTYSNIVQQCVPDPQEVFRMVMESEQTLQRAETVNKAFDNLAAVGALWTVRDMAKFATVTEDMAYDAVMRAVWALYGLERIQFMSSFAATFGVCEQERGIFQSIAKAVQKIMLDELFCHAELDREILKIELSTERGKDWMNDHRKDVKIMLDEVTLREVEWAPHLLGNGRSILGYTVPLATAWTALQSRECYELAGVQPEIPFPDYQPFPWMANWIDIDKTQNANQEGDNNNYALNVVKNDIGDEELEF